MVVYGYLCSGAGYDFDFGIRSYAGRIGGVEEKEVIPRLRKKNNT